MSNIKVIVRTRPLNRPREENSIITMTKTSATIHMPSKRGKLYTSSEDKSQDQQQVAVKTFQFDRCFSSMPEHGTDTFASQADVFCDIGTDVLDNAFEGFNSCIFAYGQTGSGKSHSMMGKEPEPGLIPRMARALFEKISAWPDSRETFKVEVSFFEIYNEKVRDLLKPSNVKKQYRIREHPVYGPYVDGLTVTEVKTEQEIIDLIYTGNKIRTVAETALNDQSSRSHSILTIALTKIKYEPELDLSHQTRSKINLVDLAGSERSSVSKTSGQRLKEGSNINKSLTTLGLVIKALVERSNMQAVGKNADKVFIPYRDSVLTWLLKECLGGNSKTVMLATVSPADMHAEETLSTLRYANTAKNIVNVAVINEDPKAKIIRKLLEEISQLKSLLASNSRTDDVDHEITRYREEIEELKDALHTKEQDMENLRRQSATFRTATRRSSSAVFSESIDGYSPSRYFDDETQSISSFGGSPTRMLSMTDLSVMPHLVDLNDDPLCSDILIHYLQVGETRVGSSPDQDIVLRGEFIDSNHCIIEMIDSNVVFISPTYQNSSNNLLSPIDEDLLINLPEDARRNLYPSNIQCSLVYINGKKVEAKTRLKHGSRIMLGRTHLFRFNHPQEAYILRQRRITEITSNSDANSEADDSSTIDYSDSQKRTKRFASIVSGIDYSAVEEEEEKETLPFILEKDASEEPLVSAISNDMNALEEQLKDTAIYESKQTSVSTHVALETPQFDNASEFEYESPVAEVIPFPSYIVDPEKYSRMPTVKVTIPHADLVTDATNSTSFHLYHIKITFTLLGEEEEWSVYRRYSHIYEFYKNVRAPKLISNSFPSYSLAENIGSLVGIPPTRMVEARRRKLETYFNALANWWISEWLYTHDSVESSAFREHLPVFAPEKSLDSKSGIWVE